MNVVFLCVKSEEDGPRAFYDPSGPENVKIFQPCDGDS